MSATDILLVLLGKGERPDRWLRLSAAGVVERGEGLAGVPAPIDAATGDRLQVAAAVPGDEVALHLLELPEGLAPAQAIAAARLMAAELSAQPAGELHVAVGPAVEGESMRGVALVSAAAMSEWIARMQRAGLDPDIVIPEPLLLLPRDGQILSYEGQGTPLYRGPTDAFCVEPELANVVLGDAAVERLGAEAFEAALAEAIAARPVDLRQGAFAKRRRWKIPWTTVRRLSLLAAAILLATLAIQIGSIMRYTFAADRAEAETRRVAADVLGGGSVADPSRRLERRLAELEGSGVGFGALASALFGAVRASPGTELAGMVLDRGTLRATVVADTPTAIDGLTRHLESNGLVAEAGPAQSGNGRQRAEITVKAR